jgi:hypothetical protein
MEAKKKSALLGMFEGMAKYGFVSPKPGGVGGGLFRHPPGITL